MPPEDGWRSDGDRQVQWPHGRSARPPARARGRARHPVRPDGAPPGTRAYEDFYGRRPERRGRRRSPAGHAAALRPARTPLRRGDHAGGGGVLRGDRTVRAETTRLSSTPGPGDSPTRTIPTADGEGDARGRSAPSGGVHGARAGLRVHAQGKVRRGLRAARRPSTTHTCSSSSSRWTTAHAAGAASTDPARVRAPVRARRTHRAARPPPLYAAPGTTPGRTTTRTTTWCSPRSPCGPDWASWAATTSSSPSGQAAGCASER